MIMYLEEENNKTICTISMVFEKYTRETPNQPNVEHKKFTYESFLQDVIVDKMIKKHSIFRSKYVEF